MVCALSLSCWPAVLANSLARRDSGGATRERHACAGGRGRACCGSAALLRCVARLGARQAARRQAERQYGGALSVAAQRLAQGQRARCRVAAWLCRCCGHGRVVIMGPVRGPRAPRAAERARCLCCSRPQLQLLGKQSNQCGTGTFHTPKQPVLEPPRFGVHAKLLGKMPTPKPIPTPTPATSATSATSAKKFQLPLSNKRRACGWLP